MLYGGSVSTGRVLLAAWNLAVCATHRYADLHQAGFGRADAQRQVMSERAACSALAWPPEALPYSEPKHEAYSPRHSLTVSRNTRLTAKRTAPTNLP